MSDTSVWFRGLFVVARRGSCDPATGISKTNEQEMTIVFPDPLHTPGAGHIPHHATRIHIHEDALDAKTKTTVEGLLEPAPVKFNRYRAFSFGHWTADLTPGPKLKVKHVAERAVSNREPMACECDQFTTLSLLPNLTLLTGGVLSNELAKSLVDPDKAVPHGVQALVRLSDGQLEGVLSPKPLGRGYFDFFHRDGAVLVQQALEEVVFKPVVRDNKVPLALTHLRHSRERHVIELLPISGAVAVIDNMPVRDRKDDEELPAGLSHFQLYYSLLEGAKREPLLRMAAACIRPDDQTTCTMTHLAPAGLLDPFPSLPGVSELVRARMKMTTETGCPCLAAQIFFEA
jgi:hypothetical protein